MGEVAVVATGETAGIEFGEQRLNVAQHRSAGGRVAHMADRYAARQAIDDLAARERVADEAEPALGMEPAAVIADDAAGLLAPVLERMQADRRDSRVVRTPVPPE